MLAEMDWAAFLTGLGVFVAAVASAAVSVIVALRKQDGRLEQIAKDGKETHALVNSNMGLQLELNATCARRLAAITKAPDDIEEAASAHLKYQEHMAQQAIVDSQKKRNIE